ncbi:TolC family protein [bacterium]|nr:TolC family protein [bacterium]MBU1959357.1 TolC family protein [bacterium]
MKFKILLLFPMLLSAGNLEHLIGQSFTTEPIKISQANLQSVTLENEAIDESYLPHVYMGGTANMIDKEGFGNARQSSSLYAKATATLYDGGKKWAYQRQYKSKIEAQKAKLQSSKNQQALMTIEAYYLVLNVIEQKRAKEQEREQLKKEIERFELFYRAGTASVDQVEKIRASKAQNDATIAELDLNLQKAQLNVSWLVGRDVSVEEGSRLAEPVLTEANIRADIEAMEADVIANKENIKISGANMRPNVQLQGKYTHSQYAYDNEGFNPNFPENQGQLMVTAEWKVFDFGMTKKQKKVSELGYIASKEQLNSQKRLAELELENAKKSLEIAKAKINAAQARVRASDSTFDAINQKFHANVVDNITYLDALSDKYDALASLKIAHNDYEVNKANYYYQAGIKLEEKIQ